MKLKTFLGFELASYLHRGGHIRDVDNSNLAKEIVSTANHYDYVDIGSEHRIVKGREVASINKKYGSHLDR